MKRFKRFLAFAGIILLCATSPVFADVAAVPLLLSMGGIFALIFGGIILIMVLLYKALTRKQAKREEKEKEHE